MAAADAVNPGQCWRSNGSGYEFEIVGKSSSVGWIVRHPDGVTTTIDAADFENGESFDLLQPTAAAT